MRPLDGRPDERAVVEPDRVRPFHRPRQEVRGAEEAGDERRRGPLVELRRRAELLDPPAVHHRDRVGHRHRFLLVVRDVDERDPDLLLDPLELHLHVLAQLEVERAERLVEKKHARMVHERSAEGDALLLSSRELLRLALRESGQADELEHLRDPSPQLILGDALALEPECDVVLDRHVREERVALKHRVDVPLVRRQPDHVLIAQEDPPFGRLLEAPDHPERGRLAAPDGPSIAKKDPRGISTEIPSTATVPSNRLTTFSRRTSAVATSRAVTARAYRGGVGPAKEALERGVPVTLRFRHSASFTTTCLMRVYSSIE